MSKCFFYLWLTRVLIEPNFTFLKEREMTIAHLKAELFQVSSPNFCLVFEIVHYSVADHSTMLLTLLQVKAEADRADVAGLLQEARHDAAPTKEELDGYRQQNERLQRDLQSSEGLISRLREQLREMERVGDSAREELHCSSQQTEELQEEVRVREGTISDLQEELRSTRQSLEAARQELSHSVQRTENLLEDGRAREMTVSRVQRELEDLKQSLDSSRQEVDGCKQQNQKLQAELQARELSVSKLREELHEAQKAPPKPAQSGPPSPSPVTSPQPPAAATPALTKRRGGKQAAGKAGSGAKEKTTLSRKASSVASSSGRSHGSRPSSSSSSSDAHEASAAHACTQTEPAEDEDVEEVIGEFQQKMVQMRELHAAEILDMEARHISESEGLRRDTQALEDECKALKAVVDKLRSSEVTWGALEGGARRRIAPQRHSFSAHMCF